MESQESVQPKSAFQLSDQIWDFFEGWRQTPKMLHDKLTLRDLLYIELNEVFPTCGLFVVGSSLNGFGNKKSDMDLCLMVANIELDQRTEAIVILDMAMNCLRDKNLVRRQKLIYAKVPILRIEFLPPYENIVVDLNANNAVAIKNTHLLNNYSSFDWRVRPVVIVVKEWAKRCGINDSNRSSFTSYSLVLMVIHYLQCGLEKPVLPSLQQKYAKQLNDGDNAKSVDETFDMGKNNYDDWNYDDEYTLADLLLGFLRYYAETFDYNNDAISVRLGKKTSRAYVAKNRSPYNTLSQWRCICIEEPFTMSNTAHSVYDEAVFDVIKKAFKRGYDLLKEAKDLDALMKMEPIMVPMDKSRMVHYNAHVTVMERGNSAAHSSTTSYGRPPPPRPTHPLFTKLFGGRPDRMLRREMMPDHPFQFTT
ncbi:hypothetical protein QR680_008788 [Steinernema hermaphroditum]|uniref:PAP-associated domain-containing protein n=1 Tax=Steinernema hermaphroditum TaxID=289476 RepID=A0AA39IJE8_9BILA|nr:hypothetical protein QR680_008788 [Steinernema hermaphroditum]